MITTRNPRIRCYQLLTLITCLFVLPAHAKYSGGTGEPNDPYQIATAADLIALGEDPNDYDKHFILTADIDLDPNLPGRKVFDRAVIAPASDVDFYPWVEGTPFTGVFDGNGHAISCLTVSGESYLGLFGRLAGAEVRSLGVVDVNITGSGAIGGLVGYNSGTVTRCYSTGTVRGTESAIGGLVGLANVGSILSQTYARSNLIAGNDAFYIGGLVGGIWNGSISDSYAICTIVAGDNVRYIGALAGSLRDTSIITCYAAGAVTVGVGCRTVGGLVGRQLAGIENAVVMNSYWDVQTSGLELSSGGSGKTTAELMDPNTFLGWNCCGEGMWTIDPGRDYPRLAWENRLGILIPSHKLSEFLCGSGTADEPYQVSSAKDLDTVGRFFCEWDKHFCLTTDIDLSAFAGDSYHVIGAGLGHAFTGVFDGNGYIIRNLSLHGVELTGVAVFGTLCGQVRSLGVEDVNVTATYIEYASGLAAHNYGSIIGCHARSNISAGRLRHAGGLVGRNWSTGIIMNCRATGKLSGGNNSRLLGGLAAYSSGIITYCYSTTYLSAGDGSALVGGLIGEKNCTCPGAIGICENSFWDIQTSGQTTSAGGAGKTTAEMQTASTFLEAGWDFVGETSNGTQDIWWILEGKDYPRLWWETK